MASDVGINQLFVPPCNIESQSTLNSIQDWTDTNKMVLNESKTKYIIFNETINYQFATRLYIKETLLEIISQTKLLGTIITSDLSWHENTLMLVRKAYARMTILRKLYCFSVPVKDLIQIYITYIRCYLEQTCVVWHSSLTVEDSTKLERVQKVALRIILKEGYTLY